MSPLPTTLAIGRLSRRAVQALTRTSGSDFSKQRASLLFARRIFSGTLKLAAFLGLVMMSGLVIAYLLRWGGSLDDVLVSLVEVDVLIWMTIFGIGLIGGSYVLQKVRHD
jgi:hypothetical protein